MGGIGLGQHKDIVVCVAARETMAPRDPRLDDAVLAPAGDQAGDCATLSPLILTR